MALFIKKILLGKCTGISFVDSTPLRVCKNLFQRLFVNGIQLITKLKSNMKGTLMSLSDKLLLRKRTIIETVNDELRNISQVEHSRHRTFDNFIVNSWVQSQHTTVFQRSRVSMLREQLIYSLPYFEFVELTLIYCVNCSLT